MILSSRQLTQPIIASTDSSGYLFGINAKTLDKNFIPTGRGIGASGSFFKYGQQSPAFVLRNSNGFILLAVVDSTSRSGSNPGIWREGAFSTGTSFTIIQGTNNRPWIRSNSVDVLKPSTGDTLPTGRSYTIAFVMQPGSYEIWWDGFLRYSSNNSTTLESQLVFSNLGWQTAVDERVGNIYLFSILSIDKKPSLANLTNNPWQIFGKTSKAVYFDAQAANNADLSGSAAGNSSATGALTTKIPLTGASVATAAANGAINQAISLLGSAAAMTTANGYVSLTISLEGEALANANASGVANIAATLSGAAIAQALANADLTTSAPGALSGNATATATATGSLGIAVPLLGSAAVISSASGNLAAGSVPLSGAALSVANGAGSLTLGVSLSGSALANIAASGALKLDVTMTGAALAQALATAALYSSGDYIIPAGNYALSNVDDKFFITDKTPVLGLVAA